MLEHHGANREEPGPSVKILGYNLLVTLITLVTQEPRHTLAL